jgi:MGT family glycosyltransferase
VNGIVTVGRNQDPAAFKVPSNVRLARYIPQSLLLDRVSVVVGHGGYGTTMGALSFGVPLVVLPLGADQPVHAMRCAELGVGEVVATEAINRATIASALQKVLTSPSYRNAAQRFAAELQTVPELARALDKLEALVHTS